MITISGKQAEAVSPEGQRASMPLADLVRKLLPSQLDTGDLVLPDGTKAVLSRGDFTILVHQTAPAVHNMKWIAEGSPAPFGPGTKYDEDVRIAQPYIIVFAVFQRRKPGGELVLSGRNEAFYRTAPLTSLSDTLMYPALLNCSKYKRQPEKHSLSWICTAKLDPSPFNRLKDNNALVRAGFRALMQTLLESGFNYSSEAHEGASWYGETLRVTMDERLKIKNWQEESKRSPLFVLDFKWLETGMTVAQVADRIFNLCGAAAKDVSSSEEVARVIFNNKV